MPFHWIAMWITHGKSCFAFVEKSVRAKLFHQQFFILPSPFEGEGGLRCRRKTDEGWAAGEVYLKKDHFKINICVRTVCTIPGIGQIFPNWLRQ